MVVRACVCACVRAHARVCVCVRASVRAPPAACRRYLKNAGHNRRHRRHDTRPRNGQYTDTQGAHTRACVEEGRRWWRSGQDPGPLSRLRAALTARVAGACAVGRRPHMRVHRPPRQHGHWCAGARAPRVSTCVCVCVCLWSKGARTRSPTPLGGTRAAARVQRASPSASTHARTALPSSRDRCGVGAGARGGDGCCGGGSATCGGTRRNDSGVARPAALCTHSRGRGGCGGA